MQLVVAHKDVCRGRKEGPPGEVDEHIRHEKDEGQDDKEEDGLVALENLEENPCQLVLKERRDRLQTESNNDRVVGHKRNDRSHSTRHVQGLRVCVPYMLMMFQ